jgi:vacuolar-type H+-ATPase subunit I/STV1
MKVVKKDERIKALEKDRNRLQEVFFELNLEIAVKNRLIEDLKTELEEEQKKYMELLERYIAMMERVAKISE